MATHRIPILGFATVPDSTEEAYFEPMSANLGDTDAYKQLVLVLKDPSADTGVYGSFMVPQNYVGTPKLVVIWTAVGTTANNFSFGIKPVFIADTEDADPAAGTEIKTTDAKSTTARAMQEHLMTWTSFGSIGETCLFHFYREAGDDTLNEDVYVVGLHLEYADT